MRGDTSDHLTPSEELVMRCYTDGLSREEVAEALSLTVHTVNAHLRNAKLKLAARHMAQAGARYAQTRRECAKDY